MIPRAICLGIGILLAASCRAAGPDWLVDVLAANNPPWLPNDGAVQLVDIRQIHYLDPKHSVLLIRGAIRIANEAGLPRAVGALVYNANSDHILSASAWIVSANGKRTKTYRRGAFTERVVQLSQYYWDAQRVIEFAGASLAEVGGTVAWEIQCDREQGIEDTDLPLQSSLPTLRTEFEVVPAAGAKLEWFSQIPDLKAVAGGEPGALRWELAHERNLPKGQPNDFFPDPRVIFVRCVPAGDTNQARTWSDFSRSAAQIVEPQMAVGSAVKTAAAALVAGKTGRWERIRALTEFVQRDIVYLEIPLTDTLAGWRPHSSEDVLRNRYGDCKDKVALLVSLLRAIGEDGRLVVLRHGDPCFVNPAWPSDQFDHAIVAIPADADVPNWWPVITDRTTRKMVVFDPTDGTTPLGVLHFGDQAGFALVIDRAGSDLVRLPASDPEHSQLARKIEATMDRQGGLTVQVDESRSGTAAAIAYSARWAATQEQYQAALERRIQTRNPLCRQLTWSDNWQADQAAYRLHFAFETASYAHLMAGGLLLLDPNILPDPIRLASWTTKVSGASWIRAESIRDETKVTLPAGCTLEELPDPWTEEGKTVSGQLSYRIEGNVLVFERRVTRRAEFYGKDDYEAVRALYQRLLEAERRPIVLRQANPS